MKDSFDQSRCFSSGELPKKHKDVAFAYIYCWDTGRVLVQHRVSDNCWGIPGGRIDDEDDNPEVAAVREISEEVGLGFHPRDLSVLKGFRCVSKARNGTVYFIGVGKEHDVLIRDGESHQLQWVEPQNWPEPIHPSMLKSIYEFMQRIARGRGQATLAQPLTANPV